MNLQKPPESNSHPTDLGVSNTFDISMKLENFMLEEYKHQDITGSLNLYLLLTGIFVSAFGLAYQFGKNLQLYLVPVLMASLFIFGIISFFFFARTIGLGLLYLEALERMNMMRDFYVQQFQPQIPTIGDILRSYTTSISFYTIFLPVNNRLGLMLALVASLCFAGVAFLGSELGFHINNGVLFPLPSDIRPYSIGLIVGLTTFLFQILYFSLLQNTFRKLETKL